MAANTYDSTVNTFSEDLGVPEGGLRYLIDDANDGGKGEPRSFPDRCHGSFDTQRGAEGTRKQVILGLSFRAAAAHSSAEQVAQGWGRSEPWWKPGEPTPERAPSFWPRSTYRSRLSSII